MAIGKVGSNGTLNENGAFYSVQDVNTLLENVGADLPEPTVADAGKAVVVDEEGKYALGDGGSSTLKFINVTFVNSGENTEAYTVNIMGIEDNYFTFGKIEVNYGSPNIVPLLASEGGLRLYLENIQNVATNVAPVITGDATVNMAKRCIDISGECTITLKGITFGG